MASNRVGKEKTQFGSEVRGNSKMRMSLSSTQIDARRRSSSDAALAPRRITGKRHTRTTSRWRDLSAHGSIRQETRDCWSGAEPERREREIDAQQGRKRARARSAGLLWSSRWPDWRTRPARQPRLLRARERPYRKSSKHSSHKQERDEHARKGAAKRSTKTEPNQSHSLPKYAQIKFTTLRT